VGSSPIVSTKKLPGQKAGLDGFSHVPFANSRIEATKRPQLTASPMLHPTKAGGQVHEPGSHGGLADAADLTRRGPSTADVDSNHTDSSMSTVRAQIGASKWPGRMVC
jgi:hypothetical protein